jgi:response regulator NasT
MRLRSRSDPAGTSSDQLFPPPRRDDGPSPQAAKRGIFEYITLGRDASALQSSLDVVLSRFAEYQGLEGAFAAARSRSGPKGNLMEWHSIDEQLALGILMEWHSIDEQLAFEMLRDEARRSNHKLIEIAEAVTMSVNLLPRLCVE